VKARRKAYHEKNPEKVKASSKTYREKNRADRFQLSLISLTHTLKGA